MSEKQGIIKAVVVLVVICFVISGALAVVNSFTAPVSKANAEARETAAARTASDLFHSDGLAELRHDVRAIFHAGSGIAGKARRL